MDVQKKKNMNTFGIYRQRIKYYASQLQYTYSYPIYLCETAFAHAEIVKSNRVTYTY